MIRIARSISILLHPLFFTLLTTAYILFDADSYVYYMISERGRWFVVLLTFVTTVMAPSALLWFMKATGQISGKLLTGRKERILPFLFYAGFVYLDYYFLRELNMPELLTMTVFTGFVLVVLTALITLVDKISAHTMAAGGLAGMAYIMILNGNAPIWLFPVMVMLSGLSGFARLVLEAHNLRQVLAGMAIGFFTAIITMQYLLFG